MIENLIYVYQMGWEPTTNIANDREQVVEANFHDWLPFRHALDLQIFVQKNPQATKNNN